MDTEDLPIELEFDTPEAAAAWAEQAAELLAGANLPNGAIVEVKDEAGLVVARAKVVRRG